MEKWLKIGVAVLLGVVALWLIMAIVSFVIGVVTTIIYYAILLTVLAILIYGAYALLSNLGGGGSSGGSQGRERERIYE